MELKNTFSFHSSRFSILYSLQDAVLPLEDTMIRLDKYLSQAGVASRRQLRDIIRSGAVRIDGAAVTDYAYKFDEEKAEVTVNGEPIRAQKTLVVMMNKPAGYITATEDARKATVMELLPEQLRSLQLKPIGRLDKETEGLLLFTNDGQLLHRIVSPRHAVEKEYYAEHEGVVTKDDVEQFARGLQLRDGTLCRPAKLESIELGKSLITVSEGRYHQVRRMMSARGMFVTYLRRVREGGLRLGDLAPGCVRVLSEEEVGSLFDRQNHEENYRE